MCLEQVIACPPPPLDPGPRHGLGAEQQPGGRLRISQAVNLPGRDVRPHARRRPRRRRSGRSRRFPGESGGRGRRLRTRSRFYRGAAGQSPRLGATWKLDHLGHYSRLAVTLDYARPRPRIRWVRCRRSPNRAKRTTGSKSSTFGLGSRRLPTELRPPRALGGRFLRPTQPPSTASPTHGSLLVRACSALAVVLAVLAVGGAADARAQSGAGPPACDPETPAAFALDYLGPDPDPRGSGDGVGCATSTTTRSACPATR